MTAVVTGGASGLGKATSRHLVNTGANVAVLDLHEDSGKDLATALGSRAFFCQLDVSDEESVKNALEQVMDKFGGINTVVNCAGIGGRVKTTDVSDINVSGTNASDVDPVAWFNRQIQINLTGTYHVIRWAVPLMQKNSPNPEGERGVIVNVSSIAALEGQVGHAAYASAKGGIASMTLPMAREFSAYGIRVMSILPGLFDTPMIAGLPAEVMENGIRQIPFPRRKGHPEEFASLTAHIIQNSYLNAECIRLDGGLRGGFPG